MSIWSISPASLSLFIKLKYMRTYIRQKWTNSPNASFNSYKFVSLTISCLLSCLKKLKKSINLIEKMMRRLNLDSSLYQNNISREVFKKENETMRQMKIIMWKNVILFARNKVALLSEVLFSLLFSLILLFLVVKIGR